MHAFINKLANVCNHIRHDRHRSKWEVERHLRSGSDTPIIRKGIELW